MAVEPSPELRRLTARERQILKRLAFGRSAKELAIELGIAPRTVERHVENMRLKMRVRNTAHMIAKAIMSGEIVFAPPTAGETDSSRRREIR